MQEQRLHAEVSHCIFAALDRNLTPDFKYYNCMGVKNIAYVVIIVSFFSVFYLRALFICQN